MTLITWWLGLPSPLLWGALAAVLNYIPYVGQAVMIAILLAVGLATQAGWAAILVPVGFYLVVNFIEGQVVFPQFVGRTVDDQPVPDLPLDHLLDLGLGAVGSLMAVPSLLIVQSS